MATRLLDWGAGYRRVAVLLALVLSGGGCAAGPETPDAIGAPEAAGPSVNGVPAAVMEAALDDAARRTSVARADIRVVTAAAVTWPDGSIGCPQPGMLYTQALVPGYRLVLQAGGEELHYHAGRDGRPRYCAAPDASLSTATPVDR